MWSYVAQYAGSALLQYGANKSALGVQKQQNKTALTQLGRTISQINQQRTITRQQTSQALFNTQLQADQARSEVNLQSAASGTVGASVQDAVSTVNISSDRQAAGALRQQMQQEEQFNAQVRLAGESTVDAINSYTPNIQGANLFSNLLSATGPMLGQIAGNAATSGGESTGTAAASTAATQNFGYDLWGSKGAGTPTTSWKSYLG